MQTTQKGSADKKFQISKFLVNYSCYYVKQLVTNESTTQKSYPVCFFTKRIVQRRTEITIKPL